MAKNEHVVIRSSIYAFVCVVFLQITIYLLAGIVNLQNPNIEPAETVLVWAARNLVPEFLGALVLAGIMAAALSSASTFLSLVGFSASNDIVAREKEIDLRTTRIIMMIIAVIVLIASFTFPQNIFWLMLFVGTVYASSWGPVGLMSVWSKSITEDAAFWGMTMGFVFNVVPAALEYFGYIKWPIYLNPVIIGTVISLLTIFILSKKGAVTKEEAEYRTRLHETPAADCDAQRTKTTMIGPLILVLYGCTMPFVMTHYYVIPYQRGTGELMADGSVNWQAGEAWFGLSSAFLVVPLGIFAAIMIWRSYHPNAKVKKATAIR
jgi:sodium/pantothenate symporter